MESFTLEAILNFWVGLFIGYWFGIHKEKEKKK